MKCLWLIIVMVFSFDVVFGQNIVKTIDITPGENSVSSSLPFDRPIILRWTAKDPVIIEYAGLEKITKGNAIEYYRQFAQTSFFFSHRDSGVFTDRQNIVTIEELKLQTSNPPANADGKFVTNIFLPPLQPNRFYDIKIIRRPVESELAMYVDLFRALKENDDKLFKRRLNLINKFKRPFEHVYVTGPVGEDRVEDLKEFYNTFLASYYNDLTGADKDKAAAAVARVKSTIQADKPPAMRVQALGYLKLFGAIKADNAVDITTEIDNMVGLFKGYIASVADHHHVGYLDDAALSAYYNIANNKLLIDCLLMRLQNAKNEREKETIAQDFVEALSVSNLPRADYMFMFGQTLSSSTASLDFDTRTGYTITPDFGYVYYGFQNGFNNMTPYIGFQLEFRYFDKNIPFNLIKPKSPLHYVSFTTGLTLTSLKKEGKRDDLFSGKSLLLGLGVRLSSATRITFGGILFNKEDPNPLLDQKRMTITPFAGISIDLKLKSLLNDFYSLSPTKKP